jgi:hypothetical protein
MTATAEIAEKIDRRAERVDAAVARVAELNGPEREPCLEFHRDGPIRMVRRCEQIRY